MKYNYRLTFPKFLNEGLERNYYQLFAMLSTYRQLVSCGAEAEHIGCYEWDGIEWQPHNIKKTFDQLNKMLAAKDEMSVTTNEWWRDDNTD